MLTKMFFLGIILLFSCGGEMTPYEIFELEINKKPNYIEYKSENNGKLLFQIPNNLDKKFQSYLQGFIEKDLEIEYYNNEECKIEINYEVTFSTNIFFSIKKKTQTMFCYPYDNIYYDFINILFLEDKLYKVNLRNSNHIYEIVKNSLKSTDIDIECNYNQGEYLLHLSFEENKTYIYLIKDKVCMLKIPLDIEKDSFKFELLQ